MKIENSEEKYELDIKRCYLPEYVRTLVVTVGGIRLEDVKYFLDKIYLYANHEFDEDISINSISLNKLEWWNVNEE